jgi:quinol monooxygenase YgiN
LAGDLRSCATVSAGDERTLTIRMSAHEASRRELQQALVAWASASGRRGTRSVHVYEDVLQPGVFAVEATMADVVDLESHLTSPDFGALLGALTVLGRDVDVSIRQTVPSFGPDPLASIRRLRSHPGTGDASHRRSE